mmetsp:Transcript_17839/g.38924  ORF Transcript_17839/g.38924 Transcript_17839/m.38924 type:complete len:124 (-) Transcript_17839:40-411(-)
MSATMAHVGSLPEKKRWTAFDTTCISTKIMIHHQVYHHRLSLEDDLILLTRKAITITILVIKAIDRISIDIINNIIIQGQAETTINTIVTIDIIHRMIVTGILIPMGTTITTIIMLDRTQHKW